MPAIPRFGGVANGSAATASTPLRRTTMLKPMLAAAIPAVDPAARTQARDLVDPAQSTLGFKGTYWARLQRVRARSSTRNDQL